MADFSRIAEHYEKTSVVQRSASDELIELLQIKETDDVLDLACGTGHSTRKIREITRGRVVGIDSAGGMIKRAKELCGNCRIDFRTCKAEQMPFVEEFDVVFCNSAFQWFNPPGPVLKMCYRALREGGRAGIQAPARKTYSPNLVKAIEQVQIDGRTRDIFAHFRSPWFFLERSEEYKSLFESFGFRVLYSRIKKVASYHAPEEVYDIFDSGASAGYLDPRNYDVPLTEEFKMSFEKIVRGAFEKQADESGRVELVFYRIYLVAEK